MNACIKLVAYVSEVGCEVPLAFYARLHRARAVDRKIYCKL